MDRQGGIRPPALAQQDRRGCPEEGLQRARRIRSQRRLEEVLKYLISIGSSFLNPILGVL